MNLAVILGAVQIVLLGYDMQATNPQSPNWHDDNIAAKAPLRRNVTAEEVGDTCLFLASPLSRGITGSTVFVDAGYHIIG